MNIELIKNIALGVCVVGTVANTYMISQVDDSPAPAPVKQTQVPVQQQPIVQQQPAVQPQPQVEPARPNPAIPDPTADAGPTTSIKFEKYKHDFGSVKHGTNNPTMFKFTNTGDIPLTITNAQASCGCTVPEWPKEPIPPNGSGEMKVIFSPKETQNGVVNKTVTVTANIPTSTVQLNISANVLPD